MALEIEHNEREKRFEAELDGHLAHADYMMGTKGTTIVFTHTEVPEAFEGQGIGSKLAKAALNYARDNELRVQPLCPFIRAYIERHPEEYGDLTITT